MNIASNRVLGWLMVGAGLCIVVCSQKIVFPGLESLLGIETIVGKQNVVYLPEGGYAYTNPGAMMRWVLSVAAAGAVLAGSGCAVTCSVHAACNTHEYQRAQLSCWSGCRFSAPVCIRKSLPRHCSARAFGVKRSAWRCPN